MLCIQAVAVAVVVHTTALFQAALEVQAVAQTVVPQVVQEALLLLILVGVVEAEAVTLLVKAQRVALVELAVLEL